MFRRIAVVTATLLAFTALGAPAQATVHVPRSAVLFNWFSSHPVTYITFTGQAVETTQSGGMTTVEASCEIDAVSADLVRPYCYLHDSAGKMHMLPELPGGRLQRQAAGGALVVPVSRDYMFCVAVSTSGVGFVSAGCTALTAP